MQRLIGSAEMELMKVIVSFRAEHDTRAAEKAQSDERLKQDIQRLMMQASEVRRCGRRNHLVNTDGKQSNCFSACAADRSTVRATNRSKCDGAAEPVSVGCRGITVTNE